MEKEFNLVTLFSIGYGSFLLIVYLAQVYSLFWRNEFLPVFPGRRMEIQNPIMGLTSPFSIGLLLTGVAFLVIGLYLWSYGHKQTRVKAKNEVYSALLTDEEKEVIEKLKERGDMTQKQISVLTGFSPVKTHRVLNRLKEKGLVEMHPFGMTNKIRLSKDAREIDGKEGDRK